MLYRLPAASSPDFVEQFEDSWGGVLLTSLYTEILKGAGDMQEVPPLPSYCSVLLSDFLAKQKGCCYNGFATKTTGHGRKNAKGTKGIRSFWRTYGSKL